MIRVPVRYPQVLAGLNCSQLLRRNLMTQTPTAKIRIPIDPGIRRENRVAIIDNDGCIADSFKSEHCQPPTQPSKKLSTRTVSAAVCPYAYLTQPKKRLSSRPTAGIPAHWTSRKYQAFSNCATKRASFWAAQGFSPAITSFLARPLEPLR